MKLYKGHILFASSIEANKTIALFMESKVWVTADAVPHGAGWKVLYEGASSSDLNQVEGHYEMVSKEEDIPQEEEY